MLDLGADGEGSWLVTAALPGHNAVSQQWLADPRTAVTAIGEGLRAMHDTLPVTDCPFSWMAQHRIAAAQRAAAAGRLGTSDWAPEHLELGIESAIAQVQNIPPTDKLVVRHGDACAPNTLIADDGRWSGHVDLGDLGVADRWADLARCHLEHRVELRSRLGADAVRRLRNQAEHRAHALLPIALGTRLEASRPRRARQLLQKPR